MGNSVEVIQKDMNEAYQDFLNEFILYSGCIKCTHFKHVSFDLFEESKHCMFLFIKSFTK